MLQSNTFQGILITNGEVSYAVFTYKCGLMAWSGGASIGYSTDGSFYYNHDLSLTSNASMIACGNTGEVWKNIVSKLGKMHVYYS